MDRDIDDAIETATRHAREAEERLVDTPALSPEIVVEAHAVQQRSEDIHALAQDATEEVRGQE